MSLLKYVNERTVKMRMESRDKQSAIEELVILLEKNGVIINRGLVIKDVWEREKQGSTGLEHGIAVPHGKTSGVTELTMAIGLSIEGIPFESLDGQPAKIIFLLLSTPDLAGPHIAMLKEIAFFVNNDSVREKILHSESADEIIGIIREIETGL